ncbi:MAG: hypothetical protein IJX90_09155 [Blautia sp.]|nr:hypothetical protein [Blautia sp.]
MEENKNLMDEPEQETNVQTEEDLPETDETMEQPREPGLVGWMNSVPRRSCILFLVAGLYVAYMGYQLCSNVLKGEEGASPVFFVVGAAFILIGVFLAFVGGRGMIREDNLRKQQQKEEEEKAAAERETAESSEMSIAQRAKLTERILDDLPEETAAGTDAEAAEDTQGENI